MNSNSLLLKAQLDDAQKRIADLEEELLLTEVWAELEIEGLRAEINNDEVTASKQLKLIDSRHELKALIEEAIKNTNTKAFAVTSVGIVWKEMIKLAKLDPKPAHVIGYVAKNIEYRGRTYYAHADERADKFSRDALAEIFRRQRITHVNTRDAR